MHQADTSITVFYSTFSFNANRAAVQNVRMDVRIPLVVAHFSEYQKDVNGFNRTGLLCELHARV